MGGLLERINTTPTTFFALIGMLFLGLYAWMYYDDGSSVDAQIAAIHQEISKSQEELDAASKVAAEKTKFQEEVNLVSDQLRAAFVYLPPTLELQDVIKRVSNEVRFSGVNLSRTTPLKSEAKGFYEEVPVRVEVEGSFAQLTAFLGAIAKVDRIISVRNLDLRRDKETENGFLVRMTGELVAYRYVDEAKTNPTPAAK
jgi:type IV pilus assembly protein PilO